LVGAQRYVLVIGVAVVAIVTVLLVFTVVAGYIVSVVVAA